MKINLREIDHEIEGIHGNVWANIPEDPSFGIDEDITQFQLLGLTVDIGYYRGRRDDEGVFIVMVIGDKMRTDNPDWPDWDSPAYELACKKAEDVPALIDMACKLIRYGQWKVAANPS